jgi:hypothetical protein
MATPISPRDLGVLLTCGAMLPFAAFFAAYPVERGKKKALNILSFTFGLLVIAVVGFVMYKYR